jgi:ubiquinone biosynthesis protein
MGLFTIGANYRNLTRLIRIVSIIAKYGFSAFLGRLRDGLREVPLRSYATIGGVGLRALGEPERVRLALQELGPAFIKLGQIMSLRPDLIPPAYARELEKLQDEAPAVPFPRIRDIIEEDLGQPVDALFRQIEEEPVASASIAQVHRAVLAETGETVAVKVLKPGTRQTVSRDLGVLRLFVRLVTRYIPELNVYQPVALMQEFSEILTGEINFLREARTMERFSRFFASYDEVHIPRVFRELTTDRVLVMEYVEGIKITDREKLEEAGIDLKAVVENGGRMALREVFDFGFFHADPHPGNLFVIPGNRIVPVDFGVTGYMDGDGLALLSNLFLGIIERDVDKIVRYLSRYQFLPDSVDTRRLKIDIYELLDVHAVHTPYHAGASDAIQALFAVVRKHHIRFPSEYLLVLRTLMELDGLARALHAEFDIIAFSKPYVTRFVLKQHSPEKYIKDVRDVVEELAVFVRALPSNLGFLFRRLGRGGFRLPVVHENIDRAIGELDRVGNRLSFAIIIASLLLSSSILVQAGIGPTIEGYPVLGMLGYFIAAVLGVWLLIGMIRSGRLR